MRFKIELTDFFMPSLSPPQSDLANGRPGLAGHQYSGLQTSKLLH
jgi:hypothetical protein